MAKEFPFLAGLETAPLEEATAVRIIEGLLGCDQAPGYDAALCLEAIAERVADFVEKDLARALFVRAAAREAALLRNELHLPLDLGYRREAVKLAGKIFDSLVGRRVMGRGPLVAALLAAGARPPAGTSADILVVTEGDEVPHAAAKGDANAEGGADAKGGTAARGDAVTLAFELEGSAPGAAYRFALADLDAACRRERERLYPRDLAARVRKAAASATRAATAPAPPVENLEPVIGEIQSGVRAKYADHGPSASIFAALVSGRLRDAAASPDEARLLGEFLNEVIAARRGSRARR